MGRTSKYLAQLRARNREWFRAATEGLACECGSTQIEWHHRTPRTKRQPTVGKLVNSAAPIARIQEELSLCDPVCRACHQKLHRSAMCPHGHLFTPENTYINPSNNSRVCRICKRKNRYAHEQRPQS